MNTLHCMLFSPLEHTHCMDWLFECVAVYVGHDSTTVTTLALLVLIKDLPSLSLDERRASFLLKRLFAIVASSCDSTLRYLVACVFSKLQNASVTIVHRCPDC